MSVFIGLGENDMGYLTTKKYGGSGGTAFHDNLTTVGHAVRVNIRANEYVEAIQFVWVDEEGTTHFPGHVHGGKYGTLESFDLEDGEFINEIEGRSGDYVDQLTFKTNRGRTHGPYGGNGGNGGTPWSMSGIHVDGAFGSAGEHLDSIGFYKRRT